MNIHIVQVRKLRNRKVKKLADGLKAKRESGQDFEPRQLQNPYS
jgi:hypothetical protein